MTMVIQRLCRSNAKAMYHFIKVRFLKSRCRTLRWATLGRFSFQYSTVLTQSSYIIIVIVTWKKNVGKYFFNNFCSEMPNIYHVNNCENTNSKKIQEKEVSLFRAPTNTLFKTIVTFIFIRDFSKAFFYVDINKLDYP